MTDWRTFTIRNKADSGYSTLRFWLDYYVEFANGWQSTCITCEKGYPFDTWQVGDQIEINNEATKRSFSGISNFNSNSTVIRKGNSAPLPPSHLYYSPGDEVMREVPSAAVTASSSSVSNSGQMSLNREQTEAFADRLVDRVEQSGGQYELDAYIQQGTEPHGTPYTRQGWVYRKKS